MNILWWVLLHPCLGLQGRGKHSFVVEPVIGPVVGAEDAPAWREYWGEYPPAKSTFNDSLPTGDIVFPDDATIRLPPKLLPKRKAKPRQTKRPLNPLDFPDNQGTKKDYLTNTMGYEDTEVVAALRVNITMEGAVNILSTNHNLREFPRPCFNKFQCFKGCNEKECWTLLNGVECTTPMCWECVVLSLVWPSVKTKQIVANTLRISEKPLLQRTMAENKTYYTIMDVAQRVDSAGRCKECAACTKCSAFLAGKLIPPAYRNLKKLAEDQNTLIRAFEQGGPEIVKILREDVKHTNKLWKGFIQGIDAPNPLTLKKLPLRLRFQGGEESIPTLWNKAVIQRAQAGPPLAPPPRDRPLADDDGVRKPELVSRHPHQNRGLPPDLQPPPGPENYTIYHPKPLLSFTGAWAPQVMQQNVTPPWPDYGGMNEEPEKSALSPLSLLKKPQDDFVLPKGNNPNPLYPPHLETYPPS